MNTTNDKDKKIKRKLYRKNFSLLIKKYKGCCTQREFAGVLSEYAPTGEKIEQTSISSYENEIALPNLISFYAFVKYTGMSADELLMKIFEPEQ